jgi:hypothetical protein
MKNDYIIFFKSEDEKDAVDVWFDEDTVWLSQQQIVEPFYAWRNNVIEHTSYIYNDAELVEEATFRKFRQVQMDGNRQVTRSSFLDRQLHQLKRNILKGKASVSQKQAVAKVEMEFESYRELEMKQSESDFDKAVKELTKRKGGEGDE